MSDPFFCGIYLDALPHRIAIGSMRYRIVLQLEIRDCHILFINVGSHNEVD